MRVASPLVDRLRALIQTPGSGILDARLLALARSHRLHLVLEDRLRLPELKAERRAAAALEAVREVELRRVLTALAAAGIRAVLLKGAAISRTHYRSPELRPRTDTDLLVPADRRDEVAGVLEALGYGRARETDGELIVAQFHYDVVDRAGVEHALDVHWRISNVIAFAAVLTYDEIVSEAGPVPGLGDGACGPSAVHSLLLACTHRVAHHYDSADLLWLYDIHLLVERLSSAEEDQVVALASARGIRAVCAYSLSDAADAFKGRARALTARLTPPPGLVEPTAAFLGDRVRPVDVLAADLRALDRWPARLHLLREHLLPSREYMFARYGTRRSSLLPWLYVRRIVAGAPKWFRSLAASDVAGPDEADG